MRVVLGVDPGVSGALAWVASPSERPEDLNLLDVADMPLVAQKSGKTTKNFINAPALADLIRHPAIPTPTLCVIEKVGAAPGQGVTSMFRFGQAAGLIEGIIAALGIPYVFVRPQEWQRDFKIRGDKDASRLIASQRYPTRSQLFSRKKDNGRSDATLIATHGIGSFSPN